MIFVLVMCNDILPVRPSTRWMCLAIRQPHTGHLCHWSVFVVLLSGAEHTRDSSGHQAHAAEAGYALPAERHRQEGDRSIPSVQRLYRSQGPGRLCAAGWARVMAARWVGESNGCMLGGRE